MTCGSRRDLEIDLDPNGGSQRESQSLALVWRIVGAYLFVAHQSDMIDSESHTRQLMFCANRPTACYGDIASPILAAVQKSQLQFMPPSSSSLEVSLSSSSSSE